MHFVGADQLHGLEERLTTDIYPAQMDWIPEWTKGPIENFGTSVRCHLPQPVVSNYTGQFRYDTHVQHRALDWLYHTRAQDERPFFLNVSFTHPHDPFTALPKYWAQMEGVELPEPTPGAAFHEAPVYDQWILAHHGLDLRTPSRDEILNIRRAYFANMIMVDEWVGELLQALEDTGVAENTIVMFSSDHGEMLGERGFLFKRCHYEWSARVPLIVSNPFELEKHGSRVDTPVSWLDLFPTFLEWSGAAPAEHPLDGSSLQPVLEGKTDQEPRRVISESLGEGVLAPERMIRQGKWKFIYTHTLTSRLFDLETDPLEQQNLSGQPEVADVEQSLQDQCLANWNPEALHQDILASQRDRRMMSAAMKKGARSSWAYEPPSRR